jgi:hypothetical protein
VASSIRVSIEVAGREIDEPFSLRVPIEEAGRAIEEAGRILPAPTVDEKLPLIDRVAVELLRDMVDEA